VNRHSLIAYPLVTEKSTVLRETYNQYSFIADPRANRSEIKKAIEETLKVKVEKVRIVNVLGKTKRLNRFIGKRPDLKKALVTLKKGEKLGIFDA